MSNGQTMFAKHDAVIFAYSLDHFVVVCGLKFDMQEFFHTIFSKDFTKEIYPAPMVRGNSEDNGL